MGRYNDVNTINEAQKIVERERAKKIAALSFNKGKEAGYRDGKMFGTSQAVDKMQKLANMKSAFDYVKRMSTNPNATIDPDTAALASDYVTLLNITKQKQQVGQSGLGGTRISNSDLLSNLPSMNNNPLDGKLIPVPPELVPSIEANRTNRMNTQIAPKAEPTETTLRAQEIANQAMKIGSNTGSQQ